MHPFILGYFRTQRDKRENYKTGDPRNLLSFLKYPSQTSIKALGV